MGTVSPLVLSALRFSLFHFTRSSEEPCVGLLSSCDALSHGEKDLSSAIGSTPFLLRDVDKMPTIARIVFWERGDCCLILGERKWACRKTEPPPSQAWGRYSELHAFRPSEAF